MPIIIKRIKRKAEMLVAHFQSYFKKSTLQSKR